MVIILNGYNYIRIWFERPDDSQSGLQLFIIYTYLYIYIVGLAKLYNVYQYIDP